MVLFVIPFVAVTLIRAFCVVTFGIVATKVVVFISAFIKINTGACAVIRFVDKTKHTYTFIKRRVVCTRGQIKPVQNFGKNSVGKKFKGVFCVSRIFKLQAIYKQFASNL